MRRLAAAAFVAMAALVPGVASAHPLTGTSVIPVNEPATILIQIPAEGASPMVGVDIEIPDGFTLDRPGPPSGWTSEIAGGVVRYRGPEVAVGAFAVFNLGGTATRKGELTFALVIHARDGATSEWSGGADSARPPIVVYAGVDPPGSGAGDSGNPALWVGVGLIAAGVAGAIVLVRQRSTRRRPPQRYARPLGGRRPNRGGGARRPSRRARGRRR